ncbi:helix-turn-helix domain-containing protein [Streptomyces sp. NBC_00690]|uniref:helix-turn-helix domain-containing protein n=1 Tax=Streptomyces sp. NBC_00690 TaxID=2975808 RepID=UPI002E295DE0|nr:helix-turn-helix domain-containing protein [Streptomyces sp. NBC_00690]
MLGAIGLDEGQESAYRALVALGAAEVTDLARRLALPETEMERALRRLEQRGLAARSSVRAGRWVAAPPGVALGALLTEQRNQLDQAELAAAVLARQFRAEATASADHDLVELVTGQSAMAHRFAQLRLGAVKEVCALVTDLDQLGSAADQTGAAGPDQPANHPVNHSWHRQDPPITSPGLAEPWPGGSDGCPGHAAPSGSLHRDEHPGTTRGAAREDRIDGPMDVGWVDGLPPYSGFSHRTVLSREALSVPGAVPQLTAALARGERVRVVDEVPTRLVIADRTMAMVPLTGRDSDPAALVVHGCGLLDALTCLFDAVWREAVPLRLGMGAMAGCLSETAGGPDATDLEILSLLLAGMTDARVAKHLDLGLRTVQRRVKGLMELTGVTTRLQLGWHAFAKGWVARDSSG